MTDTFPHPQLVMSYTIMRTVFSCWVSNIRIHPNPVYLQCGRATELQDLFGPLSSQESAPSVILGADYMLPLETPETTGLRPQMGQAVRQPWQR